MKYNVLKYKNTKLVCFIIEAFSFSFWGYNRVGKIHFNAFCLIFIRAQPPVTENEARFFATCAKMFCWFWSFEL